MGFFNKLNVLKRLEEIEVEIFESVSSKKSAWASLCFKSLHPTIWSRLQSLQGEVKQINKMLRDIGDFESFICERCERASSFFTLTEKRDVHRGCERCGGTMKRNEGAIRLHYNSNGM